MADLKDLFKNKLHVGHQTSKWNPKMRTFIHDKENKVHVIDLNKTKAGIEAAQKFLKEVKENNGKVLFVGVKPQASLMIEKLVSPTGHYYVHNKWSPGLLTNFKEIRRRIDYYIRLKEQFETGEINKYTKKEVVKFQKELAKLEKAYAGVREMRKRPSALVVLDAVGNRLAIEEARVAGIPIVSLVDTNADPDGIDYVIPANDDSVKSVGFVIENMLDSLK